VGEAIDASELRYELDAWHLGVIAVGNNAEQALRGMAAQMGRAILLVPRGEETVWAWLGDRRKLALTDIAAVIPAKLPPGVTLAIGEPAHGLNGFRLTHRQAEAAHLVAQHRPQSLTRYADVALLAFALRDEALARSLVDIYLTPLDDPRKGYSVLRETVRAYLAAERNATSAAAALGVARHTVESRIRKAEELLDRLLPACMAEIDVALRLEELGCFVSPQNPPRIDRSSIT
jgi:DNA-binding PucR family transcriptional regulator